MIDQELNIKTDTSFSNKALLVNEAIVYLEDEIRPIPKLILAAGLRVTGFISEYKMSLNAEPRLSSNFEISPRFCPESRVLTNGTVYASFDPVPD